MTGLAGTGRRTAFAIVTAVALVAAYAAGSQWSPPPAPVIGDQRSTIDQIYSSPSAPPFLYFGSSAASESGPQATDKRTLADFLAFHLGIEPSRVLLTAHVGFQPELFLAVYESLTHMSYQPRVVIAPIEMRAFSAPWLGRGDAFAGLRSNLEHPTRSLVERSLQRLQLTPRAGVTEWFALAPRRVRKRVGAPVPVYGRDTMSFGAFTQLLFGRVPAGTPQWEQKIDIQLRAHYLIDLDARHPVLQALVALGRLARQHHTAVVYYIAPVNVEDLRRHAGADAVRLERNVALVERTLAEAGEPHVLDIHDLLPAALFADQQFSCEHLTAEGRSQRAQAVARFVRAQGLADF